MNINVALGSVAKALLRNEALARNRSGIELTGPIWTVMFRITRYTDFFQRRRARRVRGDAGRSYSFELAALHVELLVAMAAVDGEVEVSEVDEVLSFLDRTSLPPDERARLHDLAAAALRRPPDLLALSAQLSAFAGRPAIARMMVQDLARVAAADAHADPREETLLDFICTALSIDPVRIPVARTVAQPEAPRARTPMPRVMASPSVREAVRRTLEASYASRDEPFGQ